MKKLMPIVCLCFLITGCDHSMIQIFETETTNTKLQNEYYVYETDTLKITYDFWAKKGVMSMGIYNKSDKPIYIDWKNSSFIYNDNKLDYWIDETKTITTGSYSGYFYKGPLIQPGFSGVQSSASVSEKPERITFIPPKSNYYRSQFYLLPLPYYQLSLNSEESVVPRSDNPKKKTTVYSQDFSFTNSPLRFRNFLSFSFNENSKDFFYTDNGFYLSSVKEMDYVHYRGYNDETPQYDMPYKNRTTFYINIEDAQSLHSRKQYYSY